MRVTAVLVELRAGSQNVILSLLRTKEAGQAVLARDQTLDVLVPHRGKPVTVSAEVAGAQRETVELVSGALAVPLYTLAPGVLLQLRRRRRALEPAQVIWLTPGARTVFVVRSLLPGVAVDKRREERHVPVSPLETTAVDLGGGRVASFRVVVIDLSGSGASLVAPREIEPGSTLGLRLPFPGEDVPVQTQARVVLGARLGRFWRIGMEFTRFGHEQQAVLLRKMLAEQGHWRRVVADD
jgi:hypothetical protein